ncbi:MAG: hypothetical protein FK733_08965 [Asgard group archaeon]|nr:hypothetical protein [Asgard group archaeon]
MVSNKASWQSALKVFLDIIYGPLENNNYKWAIMGSIASVLQGCEIEPKDIDILVEDPKTVHFISSFFTKYYGESKATTPFDENGVWVATKEQPVFEGEGPFTFKWTYTKFNINGLFIEVTHKIPRENHPEKDTNLWESGQNVWPYVKIIAFENYQIPVIPLELQLVTNMEREFDIRVKQTINIFRKYGFDETLLLRTLNEPQKKNFDKLIS